MPVETISGDFLADFLVGLEDGKIIEKTSENNKLPSWILCKVSFPWDGIKSSPQVNQLLSSTAGDTPMKSIHISSDFDGCSVRLNLLHISTHGTVICRGCSGGGPWSGGACGTARGDGSRLGSRSGWWYAACSSVGKQVGTDQHSWHQQTESWHQKRTDSWKLWQSTEVLSFNMF